MRCRVVARFGKPVVRLRRGGAQAWAGWRLSATARGATSDVLAALYVPEGQGEQPVSQLWLHICLSHDWSQVHG